MRDPSTGLFDIDAFLADIGVGGRAAEAAARRWLRWFGPHLRRRFRRWGVADQDIEDLLHDTFILARARSGQLRDPEAYVTWVYWQARDASKKHRGRLNHERHILVRDGDDSPEVDGELSLASVLELADWSQPDPLVRWCMKTQLEAFAEAHPDLMDVVEASADCYGGAAYAEALGLPDNSTTREAQSQALARLLAFIGRCFNDAQLARLKRGNAKQRSSSP